LLYLIENGFLDKKVINRTVCPVILDLLKIDKTDGVNSEHDIQLNAIGVSRNKPELRPVFFLFSPFFCLLKRSRYRLGSLFKAKCWDTPP
jgi:hypothetical protein